MSGAISYYDGRCFIYARVGDEHFVPDAKWLQYLLLRKEQPRRVTSFDTLRDLRRALLDKRGVLV